MSGIAGRLPGVPSVTRQLSPADIPAVQAQIDRLTRERGTAPVDPGRLARVLARSRSADAALTGNQVPSGDTTRGADAGPDTWVTIARDNTRTGLAAYAQAVAGADAWDIDVAAHARSDPADNTGPAVEPAVEPVVELVDGLRRRIAEESDLPCRLWAFGADATSDALADQLDMACTRELRQLRRPLPLPHEFTENLPVTRPFVVGRDEEAWLRVNHRAFAWHPDQGDMTAPDLREEEQADWFDPDGFLLHERDGELAGFCWTKVHHDVDPVLGEIYVIGVDPDHQGLGLGRGLTSAGLDHLGRKGLTRAMLYVESDNDAAIAVYHRLGFGTHHVDRAYM